LVDGCNERPGALQLGPGRRDDRASIDEVVADIDEDWLHRPG
jgi:hypothetical protein